MPEVLAGARRTMLDVTQMKGTVGEVADELASTFAVEGREFSFKASGRVLPRKDKASTLQSLAGLLELIEVTDQEPTATSAPATEPDGDE